jgi:hypothetical protein
MRQPVRLTDRVTGLNFFKELYRQASVVQLDLYQVDLNSMMGFYFNTGSVG